MQPFGTLKGFGVTFKHIFRKPITQQYPEEKRPVYPRFRGRHKLHRHDERAREVRRLLALRRRLPGRLHPRGRRREHRRAPRLGRASATPRIYEINLSRCIFCGYCEVACPFDAITMGHEFEMSDYSRDDLIFTKEMLLAEPIERIPVQDADLYDTPIPAYKRLRDCDDTTRSGRCSIDESRPDALA